MYKILAHLFCFKILNKIDDGNGDNGNCIHLLQKMYMLKWKNFCQLWEGGVTQS